MDKQKTLLEQFSLSVARFKEAIALEKNVANRDSAIKRFELTFDLAWKTLKEYLGEHFGVSVNSPKATFREVFQQGLTQYSDDWIKITDDRNLTVHTYDEDLAEDVYHKLPKALSMFEELLIKLKENE